MWRTLDVTGWARTATEIGIAVNLVQEPTATEPMVWFGTHDDAVVEHRPTLVVDDTLIGDMDNDGHVDAVDPLTLAGSWGLSQGDPGFAPAADVNDNGSVDVIDLLLLADNWGK